MTSISSLDSGIASTLLQTYAHSYTCLLDRLQIFLKSRDSLHVYTNIKLRWREGRFALCFCLLTKGEIGESVQPLVGGVISKANICPIRCEKETGQKKYSRINSYFPFLTLLRSWPLNSRLLLGCSMK